MVSYREKIEGVGNDCRSFTVVMSSQKPKKLIFRFLEFSYSVVEIRLATAIQLNLVRLVPVSNIHYTKFTICIVNTLQTTVLFYMLALPPSHLMGSEIHEVSFLEIS